MLVWIELRKYHHHAKFNVDHIHNGTENGMLKSDPCQDVKTQMWAGLA